VFDYKRVRTFNTYSLFVSDHKRADDKKKKKKKEEDKMGENANGTNCVFFLTMAKALWLTKNKALSVDPMRMKAMNKMQKKKKKKKTDCNERGKKGDFILPVRLQTHKKKSVSIAHIRFRVPLRFRSV